MINKLQDNKIVRLSLFSITWNTAKQPLLVYSIPGSEYNAEFKPKVYYGV